MTPAISRLTVEPLDLADPDAVVLYETLFYDCFCDLPEQTLIREIWHWNDEAGRIATRVPYADQRVYVVRDRQGAITLGFAVNLAMNQLQAAHFGFVLPATAARMCEILVLFTREKRLLSTGRRIARPVWADLAAAGFQTAVTTCGPRPLPLYLKLGGAVIDERRIGDETRYFLSFDLTTDPLERYASVAGGVAVTLG